MFGILHKSYQMLLKTLSEFDEIERAAIYGSRAMGNYKTGSDIDLVIYGNRITTDVIFKLKIRLEQDLPIPYFFDVTHYESLLNQKLKDHIDEFGKIIYPV